MNRWVQGYRRVNQRFVKWLWWIVIGCMLASLPIAADRYRTEQSSKRVEFVFDYRDLLEIADYKTNPRQFVEEQLKEMKKAGIRSLAVYESTLSELKLSRRIELFSSHEATALTQTPISPSENYAYVLFSDQQSQPVVQEMIEKTFAEWKVKTQPWTYKNQPGLIIEMPLEEASLKPLGVDPVWLKMLKDKGFDVVARIGNRHPSFSPEQLDAELKQLKQVGVKTILFDGDSVPGYVSDQKKAKANLKIVSDILNKNGMALAAIELQKSPQKGFVTLAKETNYNVVRLHSFTENDANKLVDNITSEELEQRIQGVADRLVLAVKDRNIRMVFLNAKANRNTDRGVYTDPLDAIYESLDGPDGAVKRVEEAGFVLGPAHAFEAHQSTMSKVAELFALVGSLALIALTLSYFIPSVSLLAFLGGLVVSAGLTLVAHGLLDKLLALGVTVCASSLGLMLAIKRLRPVALSGSEKPQSLPAWLQSVGILLSVTAVSAIGIVFVVSLLNGITFTLLLDQFAGVKVLAYLPVVLVAVYLVLFSESMTGHERKKRVSGMLHSTISVLWVIVVGIIGAVGFYYLSRTGNEGTASPIELVFRAFLENTLGVRPRTKEFLIAHPLLLLGAYLCLKRKAAGLYVLLIGAIGQASVVGTFTHLHTPLHISLLRVLYGLGFGTLFGLVAIAAWEIIVRGWAAWRRPQSRL